MGSRLLAALFGILLVAMACGRARAIEIDALGKLVVHATLKSADGAARPIEGADFELSCTAPLAFSVRLHTDASGQANTYARPGKCLLTSNAPVRVHGKSYSWSGYVELFHAKETRLELGDDNATIGDGAEPVSAAATEPIDPSADVVLPEVFYKVAPVYPDRAIVERRSGKVICSAVVGEDGYVRDVKVIDSTDPIFNASAIRAASSRRYLPAQRLGHAVAIHFTIRVDFASR